MANRCEAFKNRPMSPYKQHGISSIGFLFVAGVGALALVCVLKLFPIYVENWNLQSLLEGLEQEYIESNERPSSTELRKKIFKRFNINQITGLPAKDVVFERTKTHLVVTANYESRVALLGNIDVVVKFENNRIELPNKSR